MRDDRNSRSEPSEGRKRTHPDLCAEWKMNGCRRADYPHYHTFVVMTREGKTHRPIRDPSTERCAL